MSKPVLYTSPGSVWASAPHLALPELGIDADFSEVNLLEGANFNPEFLKLNPNATSYQSTTEVIEYLLSISSTKVAPETSITKVVHEEKVDPNFALYAARNDEELVRVSGSFANVFTITRKVRTLEKVCSGTRGSSKQPFYEGRIAKLSGLYAVLNGQAAEDVFLDETLPAAIGEGPFIGGARPGVDDFHVGSGAQKSEEGVSVLEKRFGPLPEKVKAYWIAWIARDSWVKAFPENVLH
ncbi:hypothetical protein BJV77DRAFT_1030743 [Russula vinacea]|nr:hypothetical protein BJV77DRAFT_1030743 [Russula vinacea]